jgi:hypothetical protein
MGEAMFVRVVRFTDVDQDRVAALVSRIEESDGPPPGVNSTGIRMGVDEEQGTAIVIQEFATAEDMAEAGKVFEAMDASETPGTRASVDACEVKVDMSA